jgi:hypothetical protein
MHHQLQIDTETATAMGRGVDKLVFQGVGRRAAVGGGDHRNRTDPKQACCLIAHGGRLAGGQF